MIFPVEENYYIQGKDADFNYDELLSSLDDEPYQCEDHEGEPHCVWYGKCEIPKDDGSMKTVPCLDNCKGRYVIGNSTDDLKYKLLNYFCPDLLGE